MASAPQHAHDPQARLDATFGALASPVRRGILGQLRRGEASVKALAEPHGLSLPAISRHLKVLEGAGLIARRVEGRVHRCRLAPEAAEEAAAWLAEHRRFWTGQLDRLADYVSTLEPAPDPAPEEERHES
jgi:DNA-binding transcriptional ArsR family regulator